MARFALILLVLGLASCGGAGSPGSGAPGRIPVPLPPFTSYSTDLPAGEGSAYPLKVAPCTLTPVWDQQADLCAGRYPTLWPASNQQATTSNPDRWRFVMNNEPAWTLANSGPPNQSLPLGIPPIIFEPAPDAVKYGFEIPNEATTSIPYVAAAYLRGVQGDPAPSIAPWGHHPVVSFTVAYDKTASANLAQSNYVWMFFRDVAGRRYMAHAYLWQSGFLDGFKAVGFNWNWPEVDSYYYPGAFMVVGLASDCGAAVTQSGSRWTIDAEALARCRYPGIDAIAPDFLGFELAVEGTYLDFAHPAGLPNRMAITLSDVRLEER